MTKKQRFRAVEEEEVGTPFSLIVCPEVPSGDVGIYPPSLGRVAFTLPGMADWNARLKD